MSNKVSCDSYAGIDDYAMSASLLGTATAIPSIY
jgi:hypothetical protein